MRPEFRDKLLKMLKVEEKYKQFPYLDSKGIETIAFGRNLKSKGINLDEALYMLSNDVRDAETEIWKNYSHYADLSEARKACLVDMTFNMGIEKILGFKKMFDCIEKQDWKGAAHEILDSKYHEDVGHRAEVWAYVMEIDQL